MQIHEIFRRNTNEGVLKGITTGVQKGAQAVGQAFQNAKPLAGAIASNLGGQILQKAGLPSSTGLTGPEAGYGAAQDMAAKVNEPLIKQQAKAAMDKWNKSLSNLPGGLTAENKSAMIRGLWRELHNGMMRGRVGNNFENLPGMVWPYPDVQAKATNIVSSLQQAIQAITTNMTDTTLQDWESLSRGAYQAMSLAQFENARSRDIKLTPQEEAQRQLEIDRLKNDILAKEQQLAQANQQAKSGNANDKIKAIIQQVTKEIVADKNKLASIMLNQNPNTAQPEIAQPSAPAATQPAATTNFGKGTPMPTNPYQVPGAKTTATPARTAPVPNFGKGTPMPTNPYQVPGAKTTATPVKPAAPAPTGPRVVSGGPTPAERERLAQRIAQATGSKV